MTSESSTSDKEDHREKAETDMLKEGTNGTY